MTQSILQRNNVQVQGAGERTIVFAHGFGCSQGIWRSIVPAFVEAYRVILFDYVGSGQSDRGAFSAERYSDLRGYAADVLEICAALDLTHVIFVGHSVSGMIGLLASIQAPERFDRLVMLGASACYIDEPPDYVGGFKRTDVEGLLNMMQKNYDGWASFLAPLAMKNADRPELAAELEANFRAADPAIAHLFAQATFFCDHRRELPRATAPTLLLQCAEDMIVPPEAADYLHRHLPGSTLRTLQAIGHYPHVSHPAEVIGCLQDYLASPAPPGRAIRPEDCDG